MVFNLFREHHRQQIVAQPFPDEWLEILPRNVRHYTYLNPDEQRLLRDTLRVFAAEKHWEGCGGLELNDEIRVTISAQACLLLLELEHNYYQNVDSILVYPTGYIARQATPGPDGVVDVGGSARLGEAWGNGPVVISWIDARDGGRNPSDGHNVVYHEFAHKIDMADGAADGVPRLHDNAEYDVWAEVMSAEFKELIEQSRQRRHHTLLDTYGATNEAEFFAVATETFFEKPQQMRDRHPRLYAVLRDFYRQDTAARLDAVQERQKND
jgi:Mlc titration factor MtfA (ptsG expression regulator)